MMKHAWKGYKRYAWGSNELRPISKKGHSSGIFGTGNSGATIIDAIDTLYLMGLTEEYEDARNWIATSFNFEPVSPNEHSSLIRLRMNYFWKYESAVC